MKKGFTLIELLVVIAIIAVLAGLVIIRIGNASNEAKIAKMKSDISEIAKGFYMAKLKTGKTLRQMTNNTCSDCPCRGLNRKELAALPDSDQCVINITNAFNSIQQQSGMGVSGNIRDPWGAPYLLDENEGVSSPPDECEPDVIRAIDENGNTAHRIRITNIMSNCVNVQ
ncbi:prepilin-type N-terminal cleavage/methylation domain-containing protein [bacterium]|nr:prepilin-type N-terminal cleavage/methylation domain-containing protein [bacterium]